MGCQNYDDQFSNIESQITALASQVAGLSQVQSDLTALGNTVNSLQSSVGDTVDAALADGLADIDAAVASLEAATASAASSEDVAAIAEDIIENNNILDEILAQSSVFSGAVVVNSVATLDAYHSMGAALEIVANDVTINPTAEMDATKLEELSDVFKTITGDLSVTSAASTIAELVFNNLTGAASLTLEQAGGYHFPVLQSASTIYLSDKFESTITRVNFPALTSVQSMGTDSRTNGSIEFTKATGMSFAALPRYGSSLSFTTKKGKTDAASTLDISALKDLAADGTTVSALNLSINGPNSVTVSALDGKAGTLTLQNVLTATVTDYDGSIVVNGGVETFTSNNVVALSGTMSDVITLDITGVLDPNTATDKSGPAIDLDARADLITASLAGNLASVDIQNNGNIETLTITADVNNGDINIDNNSDLETITLTGAKASGVIVNNNNSLVSVTVDATMQKTLATAATLDGSIVVTGNSDLESLTLAGASVAVLTVTGNVDLETINGTGLTSIGATAASNNVTISGNKFTASIAQDQTNAAACTTCANLEANDLGAFTTTSGMGTMKAYLALVAANAGSTASVYFDTVESTTNATGVETTAETIGNTDVTAILVKTAATAAVVTGANAAVKAKRAFFVPGDASGKIAIKVDAVDLLITTGGGSTYGEYTMTGNNSLDLANIKSALTTSRATTLGIAFDATASGNAVAPSIVFQGTGISSASNGENYTNAQVAAIGAGNNVAFLTSYDNVTVTVGNLSVTGSITTASASGAAAAASIASDIAGVWNAKYGATAGSSKALSIWGDMDGDTTSGTITIARQATSNGSRGFGDLVSIAWSKATAAQVSDQTAGVVTETSDLILDWKIGTLGDTTDNTAAADDIIITLTEVTNSVSNTGAQATATSSVGSVAELFQTAYPNGAGGAGVATTTAANIYPLEARLDVINGEASNEGVVTTAAVAAVDKTRVHWL